jgi:REP element-mobilizing transposase RayT
MQRSKIEVFIHYVWATKNREPFLKDPNIERRIHRCIRAQAEKLNCEVLAINGMPNHVHMLLKMPATVTLADIAQRCKGVSSTFAREKLFEGNAFDWQDNYGAISVSPRHVGVVTDYVLQQKQHHAENMIKDQWEHCEA